MANTPHSTAAPAESKSQTTKPDNRKSPTRTPAASAKLVALGVPKGLADTFPLTPHPTGRWCKKLRTKDHPDGKLFYFGKIADGWEAALRTFEIEKGYLFTDRTPPTRKSDGLRLKELCDRWLHYKRDRVQTGELTLRTWYDYQQTAQRVCDVLGKEQLVEELTPAEFERLRADFGQTWGPTRIGNSVTRTRMIFTYGFESGLLDKPIRYGPTFKVPNRKTLRKVKKVHGPRMFEADELLRIIKAAEQPIKAMVILAANSGMGNHDLATLPMSALDLERGWIDFARPKTEIDRKIPLWPETIAAIKEWLADRPEAKREEDAGLVFLTRQRRAWFRGGRFVDGEEGGPRAKGFDSPVSKVFKALLDSLGINGKRGFYCIRHNFETVAGDTGDQKAVDAVMGHTDSTMSAHYRERIDPERLRRVVEHVRTWLFAKEVQS